MNNLGIQAEQLRASMTELLNNCNLPVGLAYYIMKDVFHDLQKVYQESIEDEKRTASESQEWTYSTDDLINDSCEENQEKGE